MREIDEQVAKGTKGFTADTASFARTFPVVDDVTDILTQSRFRQALESFTDPKVFRQLGKEFPDRNLIQGLNGDGIIGTTGILSGRAIITQDRALFEALRKMGAEVRGIGPLLGR